MVLHNPWHGVIPSHIDFTSFFFVFFIDPKAQFYRLNNLFLFQIIDTIHKYAQTHKEKELNRTFVLRSKSSFAKYILCSFVRCRYTIQSRFAFVVDTIDLIGLSSECIIHI